MICQKILVSLAFLRGMVCQTMHSALELILCRARCKRLKHSKVHTTLGILELCLEAPEPWERMCVPVEGQLLAVKENEGTDFVVLVSF